MKTRPLLFSGEMVKAILDGRKTMTRRVIKPQPAANSDWAGGFYVSSPAITVAVGTFNERRGVALPGDPTPCPYGQPGDRLWVREGVRLNTNLGGVRITYKADGAHRQVPEGALELAGYGDILDDNHFRPSIHMPRWASRITLEIVSVRVERVQEISEGNAKAEGIKETREGFQDGVQGFIAHDTAVSAFITLWDSINQKRGFGWDSNCWVWVVGFKRIVAGGEA
jgi:hypothetical protein